LDDGSAAAVRQTLGVDSEIGANANGSYVRFANGFQVCGAPSVPITKSTDATASGSWTFPVAFSATPFYADFAVDSIPPPGFRENSQRPSVNSGNTAMSLAVFQNGAWPADLSMMAWCIAVGRWL
jgi:hypothetical protein